MFFTGACIRGEGRKRSGDVMCANRQDCRERRYPWGDQPDSPDYGSYAGSDPGADLSSQRGEAGCDTV